MIRVYRFAGLAATILLTACLAVTAQPPEKKGPPDEKGGQGKGDLKGQGKGGFAKGGMGKGGFGGGFGPPQPGQILPTFLQENVKLSDEQKKQVADLQKDVDMKLDKILTDEQKKQLEEMRNHAAGRIRSGRTRRSGWRTAEGWPAQEKQ